MAVACAALVGFVATVDVGVVVRLLGALLRERLPGDEVLGGLVVVLVADAGVVDAVLKLGVAVAAAGLRAWRIIPVVGCNVTELSVEPEDVV